VRGETLEAIMAARAAGLPVVLATDLSSGAESLIRPLDTDDPGTEDGPLLTAAAKALADDRSGMWEAGPERVFLHVFNTSVRVVIVGAVHIAQPLSTMVTAAGFRVVVVDPREAFATAERFPGIQLERSWPDEALTTLGLDHRTAVVTVTHDPKLDDPALQAALRSPAFYIGALGSRRTHAKRIARLEEAGFEESALARLHAPVGLDIGARAPGEIAASVLAEIIETLRSPPE
jgi:xanthine dehydrogenase accessory factor